MVKSRFVFAQNQFSSLLAREKECVQRRLNGSPLEQARIGAVNARLIALQVDLKQMTAYQTKVSKHFYSINTSISHDNHVADPFEVSV